jgi:hypothetical protein
MKISIDAHLPYFTAAPTDGHMRKKARINRRSVSKKIIKSEDKIIASRGV